MYGRDPSLRWAALPELFTSGYSDLGSVYRNAEDAESGASVRFFARLARKLGIFIAYGFPERGPVAGVFDSANQIGDYPEARFGTPCHVYRPEGARISRRRGAASVAPLDRTAPETWRRFCGDTLVGRVRVVGIEEGPLVTVS